MTKPEGKNKGVLKLLDSLKVKTKFFNKDLDRIRKTLEEEKQDEN